MDSTDIMSATTLPPTSTLLLSGVPGVGKTTVLCREAESLGEISLGGFYTEEIREAGARCGFRLVTFSGQEHLLAHTDSPRKFRVGRYGVDVSVLDTLARSVLAESPNTALYLVDEIGKMECLSNPFVVAMRTLLNSDKPLVATIARKGKGFIAETQQRADTVLWEVTRANRDHLPQRVMEWLNLQGVTTALVAQR